MTEEKVLEILTEIQSDIKVLKSDVVSIKKNITIDALNRSSKNLKIKPFEFLRNARHEQVANLIQDEQPKTIAVILANLEIDFAAMTLMKLAPEIQVEVVKEISLLGLVSPKFIKEVEELLIEKLSAQKEIEYNITEGGISTVVEILNRVDRKTEKSIAHALDKDSPEISEEIRKRLLVFASIVDISDRDVQLILRSVDSRDLALAMKATANEVSDKIYKNMSKRAADVLREEVRTMKPVNIRDVEEAQMKIVNIIRVLNSKGEISLVRGQDDEMIV